MENTFYLEIITPDQQFYTGPADQSGHACARR